jgi:signal transduction histidine kinase
MLRRDGQYRYVSVRGVPVLEPNGSIREWIGTCTDITDRKTAEERQNVTNSLLELFAKKTTRKDYLDSTVGVIRKWSGCEFIGIRIRDNDGNIPYESYVGFDREFLSLENALHLKRDKCVCIRAILENPQKQERQLMSAGGSFYCNDSLAFLDGLSEEHKKEYRGNCIKRGFQSIAVVPIRYHDEVLGAIHLTDYKKDMVLLPKIDFIEATIAPLIGEAIHRFNAEAELEKYRLHLEDLVKQRTEELARSNKDLEQFAYVASHDLQEPLRAVSGFVELLRRNLQSSLDDKTKEYMNFTIDGAKRMQSLIIGLLEYSRVGTQGKNPQKTDSKAALDEAIARLQASIKETGAKITTDGLPTIHFDDVQLTQLFQNLIGNAIKFRREQAPRIHINAVHKDSGWQFAVTDNGIGVEPQYTERIFQIFQRLHGRGKYPGTGIGLSICKKIVERHNGKIWVESKPGNGSTFYFTVPD